MKLIAAAGGCHVSNYIVGPQNAFVKKLALSAGLGYLGFTRPTAIKRLFERAERLVASADGEVVLIIQIGNFETINILADSYALVGRKEAFTSEYTLENTDLNYDTVFRANAKFKIKEWLKLAFFKVSSSPATLAVKIEAVTDELVKELEKISSIANIEKVVVLGPLPSLRYSLNHLRRLLDVSFNKRFADLNVLEKICYVSAFDIFALNIHGKDLSKYYADPDHLNAEGHNQVFEKIQQRDLL
ncbi:MAG: SGNH/GDSL hydrolase family protein [Pseudacidovorax sp.]|uniref:SGNH/GDSL hydrolase family protein n=1 Tax=Pseudacidovorax sp. TaxID=1934311 RepID=UPI001B570048|nr:SGNH/GDSL hydrolase family protein [Pseudacidovorax sp.]MBP6896393.1 SGNH/GDSL hydrolase family protein [Pseudacidovorax sp.]